MKNMKKVMILVVIFSMILTVSAWAISAKEWELKKLNDRYESKETAGAIVITEDDGDTYIIEFDTESGYYSMTDIDEDGYAETDVYSFEDNSDGIREIYILH